MSSSSLQDLLSQDGFQRPATATTTTKPKQPPERTARRSFPSIPAPDSPANAIDESAVRSVITILSGYAGRFLKDPAFRRHLRDKCAACLAPTKGAAHAVLANLQLGIDSTERLAEDSTPSTPRDSKVKSLRNSIRLLSVVASLSSSRSRADYTCGVPNSHLSACAQLYLSVVYKIERNDRASAGHLLQVFCDAPYLARGNLLPDLWDHFFLPHLLHLKVWYASEVELDAGGRNHRSLTRAYNDQMDAGTAQFALYYKEWLKADANAPPVPSISLPSRPSCSRRSTSFSLISNDRSLYDAVFGSASERGADSDVSNMVAKSESDARIRGGKLRTSVHSGMGGHQRRTNSVQENPVPKAAVLPRKSNSFRIFSCRSDPNSGSICGTQNSRIVSRPVATEPNGHVSSTNLGHAISLISYSDSLNDCENAIRVVAKAWLDSSGGSNVDKTLFTSSVIEGLLEVALASKDDEVLELTISILAELVARNEANRQVVLNADPQLEIFLNLLRSNSLCLKAAALLYLLKPKAKQMLSLDWIPLVLHLLDSGDHMQNLFNVQCSPKLAAFYFLDQLLKGFDVDRNAENAKQMVAIGGLDLLIRRLKLADPREKKACFSLLFTCIRADGSCRHYLAANIRKELIVQMLIPNQVKSNVIAVLFIYELLCLDRISQIIKFLNGLKNDGCLNTMHLLLVYLQHSPPEQRPLAAVIILLLDLLGDPLKYSIYREEGIDAIVEALEHSSDNKKLQQQCSRALLLLGSRFSFVGVPVAEAWLLKRAGMDDVPADLFNDKEITEDEDEEERKATEDWLRRLAVILLKSGNKRFLVALSNCIADGNPHLARSCLVTVGWMSNSLSFLHNANTLSSFACSILAPQLLLSLSYDRAVEERVLASLSLLNFVRHPECLPKLYPLDKETIRSLQDLAQVTWTAKELLLACCR